MSRKGKKAIVLEKGVDVKLDAASGKLSVKGPKGELSTTIRPGFELSFADGQVFVINKLSELSARAFHGLYQSLLANMVQGVSHGFQRDLELFGVGFRVQKKGNNLEFSLGYSHPVVFEGRAGIQFDLEGNTKLAIKGIDKQLVGQVAAEIIGLRNAARDPYKNKGIRFVGVPLRKKAGKKVK